MGNIRYYFKGSNRVRLKSERARGGYKVNFEVDEIIKKKLEEQKIRLEYSSLLNQTNQFIFRHEDEDFAIIVPRITSLSRLEAIWSLAHEYGHYIIRKDQDIKESAMNQLYIERLSWEKGRILLEELKLPTSDKNDTYEAFAERSLDTYKINSICQKEYQNTRESNKKIGVVVLTFSETCKGIMTLLNGTILAYMFLVVLEQEKSLRSLFIFAIFGNALLMLFRYIVSETYKQLN